ncbi:hypothetical protein HC762_01385, partial [bacterium]|nr:hypothetical protein [bacterium]
SPATPTTPTTPAAGLPLKPGSRVCKRLRFSDFASCSNFCAQQSPWIDTPVYHIDTTSPATKVSRASLI